MRLLFSVSVVGRSNYTRYGSWEKRPSLTYITKCQLRFNLQLINYEVRLETWKWYSTNLNRWHYIYGTSLPAAKARSFFFNRKAIKKWIVRILPFLGQHRFFFFFSSQFPPPQQTWVFQICIIKMQNLHLHFFVCDTKIPQKHFYCWKKSVCVW